MEEVRDHQNFNWIVVLGFSVEAELKFGLDVIKEMGMISFLFIDFMTTTFFFVARHILKALVIVLLSTRKTKPIVGLKLCSWLFELVAKIFQSIT